MRKAVFLDRDGVINHDPGDYTCKLSDFQILPDVFEALRKLNEADYELVVITNQAGISKGRYSQKDFEEIDRFMHEQFQANEVRVLETFFCPHQDAVEKCLCRKPKSLLVEKALAKYRISARDSVMVGDKERDVQCAEAAGVRGVQIPTNDSLKNHIHLLLK